MAEQVTAGQGVVPWGPLRILAAAHPSHPTGVGWEQSSEAVRQISRVCISVHVEELKQRFNSPFFVIFAHPVPPKCTIVVLV